MFQAYSRNLFQFPKKMCLIIIGKNEHEKSESGNSILYKNTFTASCYPKIDTCSYWSREVQVLDFPDIFNETLHTEDGTEKFRALMQNVVYANLEGYHAFLIVLKFGNHLAGSETSYIEFLKNNLGEYFLRKYGIILMTNGGDFSLQHKLSIDEYCEKQSGAFKQLVTECNNRIVLFDNYTTDKIQRRRQRERLFQIVVNLGSENGRYTKTHFEEAQGLNTHNESKQAVGNDTAVNKKSDNKEVASPRILLDKQQKLAITEINIMLMGPFKSGKSLTGNSILNKDAFRTYIPISHSNPGRTSPVLGECKFMGCHIQVVDCLEGYGIDWYGSRADLISRSLTDILLTVKNGYNAFLYVIKLGSRLSREEIKIVEALKQFLGERFLKDYGIIVMTNGDVFRRQSSLSLKTFCEEQTGPFKELLEECNNRIVLFENLTTDEKINHDQRKTLINMVKGLQNQNARYTFSNMNFRHFQVD
ncbi:GTPase IMAP family member 8-like [Physella acuta]|uniref:GTPase IMAP family member 8-like n=1 Tax=Physella acuta TaxID=109671 RepID=UPI0027DCF482|nr:GTPase IMAP family member 8-like [Physella acuta]